MEVRDSAVRPRKRKIEDELMRQRRGASLPREERVCAEWELRKELSAFVEMQEACYDCRTENQRMRMEMQDKARWELGCGGGGWGEVGVGAILCCVYAC